MVKIVDLLHKSSIDRETADATPIISSLESECWQLESSVYLHPRPNIGEAQ
ncbi:hypothetical protein [Microcoleus sp. AR_TQ3_B6]|uniref:hypothetical protein n=1 Tax=Microcoleus sp. AR_TQ3_B6 TaxID=3055284 RepID=UPI002FD2ECD5